MPRFVLLEHTGHPDDPTGRHYDLLLEEAVDCRTWRLAAVPAASGAAVAALPLPPHRLAWLDIEAAEVSGGRGFARRVDAGEYAARDEEGCGDDGLAAVTIVLQGDLLRGRLSLVARDGWTARLEG